MKKYGKYERMPDGTRAKQPGVKGMLLQTYFTSLLCMVLCVTMFFGTTFAWFTSEVENSGNEIYIGTLDVGLEKFENTKWVSLDPKTGSQAKLFDNSIKWEPGYTALETIRITNEGELSFRYALAFANAKITNKWGTDAKVELLEVAEHFTVYVHEGEIPAGEEPKSFADIEASAAVAREDQEDGKKYWRAVRMGKDPATLADILEKGFPVLSGNIETEDEIDTYVIALHMDAKEMPEELLAEPVDENEYANWLKEHFDFAQWKLAEEKKPGITPDKITTDAWLKTLNDTQKAVLKEEYVWEMWQSGINAMMGHSINMNVKLTAYQRTHEEDAFDSSYDLKAHVTNLGALDISYTAGIGGTLGKMTLDSAYQFLPVESYEESQVAPYRHYIADFAVWADRDIPMNGIALAGYYSFFCEGFNNSNWVALLDDSNGTFKTADINEKKPIRLVQNLYPVTYELLCQYGNDGVGFLCGLAERNENGGVEAGTVITVELRMYEVVETAPGSNKYEETGNYIVAGRYEYTFE